MGTDGRSARERWLGGYVRTTETGERVFVIERKIAGAKFHVSTRCRTLRAALRELERFEADPRGYAPGGEPAVEPLRLSADLLDRFERWQVEVRKLSPEYVAACGAYLEQWLVDLDGADLRDLRLADLHRALDRRRTARRHRVIALKAFFAWARRVAGLLTRADDATADLAVPPARPERLERRKVVDRGDVVRVLGHLSGQARDVLEVLAATGLHLTEIRRFAESGEIFARTAQQPEHVAANLAVRHKSGALHVVALVHPEHLEAARRIRAAGRLQSKRWLYDQIARACDAAGVRRFGFGVMRHSLATWLSEAGVAVAAIGEFLGHRSPRTTARYYVDLGASARALPVPHLRVVSGGD